ncbi:rCG57167 [Rattus norvegicus]|uniref:RCG57167 n=1 Tax=Rattus norvegicus TaxID=10116 RepID=A6JCX6_RAT|nr:rCG57167 [Rattus norvegicus]
MSLPITSGHSFPLWLTYKKHVCTRELATFVKSHKTTSSE